MAERAGRRPRIAYLSYSTGEYDARTFRMARSAIEAGYDVTMYARWHPGLLPIEDRDGYRLIRAPFSWRLLVPGLRGRTRRSLARQMADAARSHGSMLSSRGATVSASPEVALMPAVVAPVAVPAIGPEPRPAIRRPLLQRVVRLPFRIARRVLRGVGRRMREWRRIVLTFPLRPMAWATALEDVATPADIWHGMWAGSLPALDHMRRRLGGRTIYDSRDIYLQSREFFELGQPIKGALVWFERHWARSADRVLTVNDEYADLLVDLLGVPRPQVVMNCPDVWRPSEEPIDLIRRATGIPETTFVALYQGKLMSQRGIEQTMDAILEVPEAALVLLGFGDWERKLRGVAASPPYLGRVFVLPAVAPDELLRWTACADVMVMAIQPTSMNHEFTTPQKLFEAIATGVPVVAADLPGMAAIVRANEIGVLCVATSPTSIAEGIRKIVRLPSGERQVLRERILDVAHTRYNWDAQLSNLFALYQELAPAPEHRASRLEAPVRS